MYQADFWIVWHLCLLESPNGFADSKENAICLITELHSAPALPPSYIPQQGFIVPFQSDVLIPSSPVDFLSRAAALTWVSPAFAFGVRHLLPSEAALPAHSCCLPKERSCSGNTANENTATELHRSCPSHPVPVSQILNT